MPKGRPSRPGKKLLKPLRPTRPRRMMRRLTRCFACLKPKRRPTSPRYALTNSIQPFRPANERTCNCFLRNRWVVNWCYRSTHERGWLSLRPIVGAATSAVNILHPLVPRLWPGNAVSCRLCRLVARQSLAQWVTRQSLVTRSSREADVSMTCLQQWSCDPPL